MCNMKKILSLVFLFFCALSIHDASAQKIAVGTNAVDYVNLGTINLDAGISVSQHWSVHAGFKYNPWRFKQGTPDAFQNSKRTFYVGPRFWFWHVYSGWWVSAVGQYQEYNHGGWLFGDTAEEGDAWGMGLSAGYTLMLNSWFNLEFALGAWGGYTTYTSYECAECGRIVEQGFKYFIMPNTVNVSAVFVF